MLGTNVKVFFSIEQMLTYSIYELAALKTLNTYGGVILSVSFPDNIIVLKNCIFNCDPLLCPLSIKVPSALF